MKISVTFRSKSKPDGKLYDHLKKHFLAKDDDTRIYGRNLFNIFKGKPAGLLNPQDLDHALDQPDITLVLLSKEFLEDEWLGDELRGLYLLEQHRKEQFLLPVLVGGLRKSAIPKYFKEGGHAVIDFNKDEQKGMAQLDAFISKWSKQQGKIFIGHGGASDWKDLREFLQTRLKLEYEEFSREPVAGRSNIGRVLEMLENAKFAFLIMTAEDEHDDKSKHARENVIHEAGLFQGRLGLERAIILLEEGCSEFSNIAGLGQIRFKRGKIAEKFDEIRRVLERQKII
jgi:hypothetical protein